MSRLGNKHKGKRTLDRNAVERLSPQTNWEHQQAVNAWLRRNTADKDKTAIFFTLKFHRKNNDGFGKAGISETYASKLVSKWLNRLDRELATKREVARGCRIERVVFKHKGFSGENLHWHGVLLTAGDADVLLSKCERYWQEERGSGWVDAKRSQFEIARHNYAVSAYAAHEVYKLGVEDSWSLEHTNMSNDGLRIAKQEAEQSKHKMLWLRELRMVMGTIITYLHLCEEKNRGNNNLPKDKDWATKLALLLLLQAEQHEQSSFI